ncbi:MAG: hypothetical protein AAGJ46_20375, partial [Planctomycetota bacterium]
MDGHRCGVELSLRYALRDSVVSYKLCPTSRLFGIRGLLLALALPYLVAGDAIDAAVLKSVFQSPNSYPGSDFGAPALFEQDRLIVSDRLDASTPDSSGRVFIFDATIGELAHTILDPTPSTLSGFGSAIAAHGDSAIVGDLNSSQAPGQAHVFDVSTGVLEFTLNDPSSQPYDGFGKSVAISDRYIVVGDPFEDSSTERNVGAVYVYTRDTANLVLTLEDPHPRAGGRYGNAVAIAGDTIAVQSVGRSREVPGRVLVYNAITGDLSHVLEDPFPEPEDSFGAGLALQGSSLLVGDPGSDLDATDAGVTYLFDALDGALIRTISSPNPRRGAGFGSAVAIDGNRLLIGS